MAGAASTFDALVAAARYIRASDRPVRHIITITDGNDTVQQEGALDVVRALHAERITLTSIAVGQGSHVPFIRDMAAVGGGRTFLTERAADLPDLLMDERGKLCRCAERHIPQSAASTQCPGYPAMC